MPRKNNEEIIMQEDIPTRIEAKKIFRNEKQKIAEERKEYVPVFDAKQTVEIPAKPKPSIEEIEKIETPEQSKQEKPQDEENGEKRRVVKKAKAKPLETLKGNSILIITEKPQAAEKIASALSDGKFEKRSEHNIPYYEFKHPKTNEHIIVACAVGHLFTLSQDISGSNYPIFEVSWKPNFEVRKKDFTKKYYSLLSKLVKRAKEIIVATDYDIEGEVIGYNIVRFIANQKDAKRMKFSSLTNTELKEAFEKVQPTIDWGQAIAGETRHFIDWYYGINLSRALMSAMKSGGRFRIMSSGRVQGPTLKLIVEKEEEIKNFKPQPYWKVFIEVVDKKDKTNKARLRYIKDIFKESELEKFKELKGKTADVETEKKEQSISPPHPFDLTTLQTEVYNFFSINPSQTLAIAQELYLRGLISYPRTSSQKIPPTVDSKLILKKLSKKFPYAKLAIREQPIEGKKTDPAHPSIYPTGDLENLDDNLKKIYELIVRRFIACFCKDALVENKTITASIDGLVFKEKGLEIKESGWMEVYQAKLHEKELKDMNGKAGITKVDIEKDETKPPKRYSPASLISTMEKLGLGTKATRANILETLYDRGYITDNRSIKATPLGINLINTLKAYSPIIIDEKLTRNMERDMESIQVAKKELEKKKIAILDKAKQIITKISEDFKREESQIGSELIKATDASIKEQNEISLCPNCKQGMLTLKYSPKFKRGFVACNRYPECKITFSLPPQGLIKKTDKICEKCGFPLLMSIRKGKRPWVFCFNPECPSRTENKTEVVKENKKPQQENENVDSKAD